MDLAWSHPAWSGENLIAVSIPAPSDNNPLNILEKHKKYYKYLENNDKSYKQLNNSQHSPSRLEGVEADRIGLPTPKIRGHRPSCAIGSTE
ncbi:MAG: hypothetical protein OXF00_08865 [bacterium]|nr:hypothetical protein [bacterium]